MAGLCPAKAAPWRSHFLSDSQGRPILSGGAEGRQSDIVIVAKEITRIREKLSKIISLHTGQPLEKVEVDIEKDNFMEAEEALAYGLADEIIKPEPKNYKEEA